MKFAPICACLALVVVGLCDARPEQMVGAPIGMSPEEAERVQLMGERKLNEANDEPMMRRVVEVRSGTKQLVSGLLYKLQVAVRTTDLAKGEYSAERLAAANLTGPTKYCEIVVHDIPWLSLRDVKVTCDE